MKDNRFPTKKVLALAVAMSGLSNISMAEFFSIEEVIVTAQKKAENLQDVPVSVSAMNAGDLEGLKLRHSTEIAAQVPNMQIQTPFGESQPIISIRGVSMQDFNLNQNSPVGFYVDEVYIGPTYMQGMQMFDLERVEVLRGPQGTLYGKNTTGGAVNFYTKKPNFEENGYITLGLGNYNRREVKGAYETVLVEDLLAARGAFTYTKADGYMENAFPGADDLSAIDEWAGRVTVAYTPSDSLEAYFRYHKGESTPSNYGTYHVGTADGVDYFGYSRASDGLDDDQINANLAEDKEMTNEGASLTVNWEFNEQYTLTSITSYDEGTFFSLEDDDGTPNRLNENTYAAEARQLTQDLRLTSDSDGPFNWIGGLYWGSEDLSSLIRFEYYYDADLFPTSGLEPFDGFAEASFNQQRDSYAAYFHSTYDFTEQLSLTFGLRYTEDETTVDDFQSVYGEGNDSIVSGFLVTPQLKDSISDENLSGKIGLGYQMDDGTLLYASFSTGYRNSTYNGGAVFDAGDFRPVDAEEVKSYELGFKSTFLDNGIQLNGAVFQYDYTDQQFLNFVGLNAFLENAGASTIRGIELELVARPTEDLSLQAGLGILDAEFDELTLNGTNLSGNELVSAPETNFNMSIDYEVAALEVGTVSAHVDSVYTSDQFFSVQNDSGIGQDAYWIHNARLSLESSDDTYSIALWVKNLSNEFYYTYGLDLKDFYGMDFFQRGTPRTFGLEGTYRF